MLEQLAGTFVFLGLVLFLVVRISRKDGILG
jgi:hypothetical protein